MLITKHFAWAHLPKAAGDATQQMLAAVPGLIEWADSQDSNDKHDPFWRHEEAVTGKLLVDERPPAAVVDPQLAHHKAVSGIWPDYEPLPMPTVEEMVESTGPDDMLRYMTDGARFPVERWLRKENLGDDVTALLDELGLLTEEATGGNRIGPVSRQGLRPRRHGDVHRRPDPADVHAQPGLGRGRAARLRRRARARPSGRRRPAAEAIAEPNRVGRRARPAPARGRGGARASRGRPTPKRSSAIGARATPTTRSTSTAGSTSLYGPELEAIDRELAAVGPSLDNYALFRELDDDVWALLLGRRYSTYKSILETPSPRPRAGAAAALERRPRPMTLLSQSKAFYRHARAMQAATAPPSSRRRGSSTSAAAGGG